MARDVGFPEPPKKPVEETLRKPEPDMTVPELSKAVRKLQRQMAASSAIESRPVITRVERVPLRGGKVVRRVRRDS